MTKIHKKDRIRAVLQLLDEHYGTEKICYLNHNAPWQKDILKAWTADNKGSNIPRLSATDQYANYLSDRFLTKSCLLYTSIVHCTKHWMHRMNFQQLYCSHCESSWRSFRLLTSL